MPGEVYLPAVRRRVARKLVPAFARIGYRPTTVRGLAGVAGISIGRFYDLFRDRESCFDAVLELILEEAEAAVVARVDRKEPWPTQVEQALEGILATAEADRDAAKLVLIEAQLAGSASLARYQELIERLVELLGEGRQFLPGSADLSASHEPAMVSGIACALAARLERGKPLLEPGLLEDFAQLLLEPYRLSPQQA